MGSYSSISIEELVRRCSVAGNPEAWEEFIRRFHRTIAVVVLRAAHRLGDGSTQTVDDLIQETYLKLCADNCRVLRTFEQKHPDAFIGYIKVVTANVVRDQFKSSFTKKRGARKLEQIADDFTPEANESSMGGPRSIERAILVREISQHLEACVTGPDRERNSRIFWLHYRAGLSARAIAGLPGVGLTTKGVESIIIRITKELRERMSGPTVATKDELRGSPEGFLPA